MKRRSMVGWLSAASLLCVPGMASAQVSGDEAEAGRVAEIVVTARKRAENIQTVPIAITAFSNEELQERGAYRLRDLEFAVPNLLVVGGPDNSSIDITLRGIRASAFNAGFESGLSVYVDGVVLGRPFGFNQDFADFERIEVLRGPQGSTFGKNTISGAISMVTRKPGAETEISGSVRVGDYGLWQGYAALNSPIIDGKLFGKLTLFGSHRDGFIDNPTGPDLDDEGASGGRVQLRATPSEALTIDISADLLNENRAILYGEAADSVAGATPGPRSAEVNIIPNERRRLRGVSLSGDYELANATLTSITAYRDAEARTTADADRTGANLVDSLEDNDQWQFSQELRVASGRDAPLSYVAGLYFFRQELDEDQIDFIRPGLGRFNPNFRSVRSQVGTTNYAAFANLTYRFTDALEAFGGLRVDHEKKDLEFVQTGAPIPGSNVNIPLFNDAMKDTSLTPTIGVNYTANRDLLLYAKYARGVKSGGWNAEFSATPDIEFGPEHVDSFEIGLKSDWLDDALRVNIALFHLDYEDLQVATFVPATSGIAIENAASARSRGVELEVVAVPVQGVNLQAAYGYVDAEYTDFIGSGGRDLSGTRLPSAAKSTFSASASIDRPVSSKINFIARADYSYRGPAVSSVSVRDAGLLALQDKGIDLVNARVGLADADDRWQLSLFARNLFDELYLTSVGRSFSGADNATYGPPRTYGLQLDFRF